MSIEVEIQKAKDRKPIPVWVALERLDKIAAFARLGGGHIRPYPEEWEPTPKAQPCPPIAVATYSTSIQISEQLTERAGAWDGFKFIKGTETRRESTQPIAVEKPKTYVGLTPAQIAKDKFEQVKRELAAKIAARREAQHGA
jgi:hypothetical protein